MPEFPIKTHLDASKPMRPLILLLALLAVMIGAMSFLSRPKKAPKRIEVIVESTDVEPAEITTAVVRWLPETASWGVINDTTTDGRRLMPTKSLAIAAERVAAHSWGHFKSDTEYDGFQPLDVDRTLENPSRYRGRPIEVVGTLETVSTIDTYDVWQFKLGDHTRCHTGRLTTSLFRHGKRIPVEFLMVDDVGSIFPVEVGSPCKLQGVFFKLAEIDVDGKPELGVYLLAKRAFPSYVIPDAEHVDLTLIESAKDDMVAEDVTSNIFNETAMMHLLAESLYAPEKLVASPMELQHHAIEDLIRNPANYRGKAIEFDAKVFEARRYPMGAFFPQAVKGDAPIGEIYHLFATPDNLYPVRVISLVPPPADLTANDRIKIKGVFYRLWGYKTAVEYKRAPLIVACGELVKLPPVEKSDADSLVWYICGFIVFAGALLAIIVWRERGQSELFRRERLARKQVLRGGVDLNTVAATASARDSEPSTPAATEHEQR